MVDWRSVKIVHKIYFSQLSNKEEPVRIIVQEVLNHFNLTDYNMDRTLV